MRLAEGDLSTHIRKCREKGQRFPEELVLNWFAQIMLGLKYIHRHNIIHRDLKTSNIFLQENGDLKIGDFGIARVLDATLQNAETVVGTPYYMSPEICQNHPYSFKSDVWSLGCILYELCTLEHPFRSNNLLNLVYKIVHEDPEPVPSQYSAELGALIGLLLRKKAEERPMLDQLLQVDFVKWFLVGFMNTEQAEEGEGVEETSRRLEGPGRAGGGLAQLRKESPAERKRSQSLQLGSEQGPGQLLWTAGPAGSVADDANGKATPEEGA